MEMLFNVLGQATKKSLKRFFLEAMVRAAANAAGNAAVKGMVSAIKKLKQGIARLRSWEIDGIELTIVG